MIVSPQKKYVYMADLIHHSTVFQYSIEKGNENQDEI